MKKTWVGYVALGVAAYLVFLAATLPVAHAYRVLAPKLAPLALYDVRGTLWSGAASAAVYRGVRLDSVQWKLKFLPLLRGRLQVDLTFATNDGSPGSASVGRGLGGALYLDKVNARLPAAQIASLLPPSPMIVGGTLEVKLHELVLGVAGIEKIRGTVDWKGGTVLSPKPVSLGDFSVTFVDTGQGIEARVRDQGGPLEANGTLRLAQDGSYEFKGALATRNTASPELTQALQFIGRPGADGKIPISYTGRLRATGNQAPGLVKTTTMKGGAPQR